MQVVAYMTCSLFLFLNGISLYGCITNCSSIHQFKDIFVVSTFGDDDLSSYNVRVQVSVWMEVLNSQKKCLAVGLLINSHGIWKFKFIRNCRIFSKVAVPFCFLTSNMWKFYLLHTLASTWCTSYFFYVSHSNKYSKISLWF